MFTTCRFACLAGIILIGGAAGLCEGFASTQPAATQPAASQPSPLLEELSEQSMQSSEDLLAAFKTITDVPSAEAAVPAIEHWATQVRDLRGRAEQAGIHDTEIQAFVESKHPTQVKALRIELASEVKRLFKDEAVRKIINKAWAKAVTTQPAASQPSPVLEELGEEYMQLLEGMVDTLKTITNVTSAGAATPSIENWGSRWRNLMTRAKKAGISNTQIQEFLEAKHPAQMKALTTAMTSERDRLGKDKAVIKIVTEAFIKARHTATTQPHPK